MSIENFEHNGEVYAIILRSDYETDGIEFFTPGNFSQQLGYMKRPSGYKIAPHIHLDVERSVVKTQEVLFLKRGKVLVNFYDYERSHVGKVVLQTGDIILLAGGGHGFEMLEESVIVEVKQGPYCGDSDKMRF